MDLIRKLLLIVEANPEMDGTREFRFTEFAGHSTDEVAYSIRVLIESGYLKGNAAIPSVKRLTWDGHEFPDNIKDPGIRGKTKKQLSGLPGAALTVVAQIAQAEIRKHPGLP